MHYLVPNLESKMRNGSITVYDDDDESGDD